MKIAPDFRFQPLPPIDPPGEAPQEATAGGVVAEAAPNPLGRLAGLKGTWSGTGFNVIWRPDSSPDSDRFLELNLTKETLQVEEIPGAIPNRGLLQSDMEMFGLHYLQQISDSNLDAGLHLEPGVWAHVPKTSNPKEPVTVVRMASIPHGTTILAQGRSSLLDRAPHIPKVDISPFSIGGGGKSDFDEQHLNRKTKFRTTGTGLTGITQAMLDDPNTVLRAAIAHQQITETVEITISTAHTPVFGGGTRNTAFLRGGPDGPNADAVSVTATFWIERLAGDPVVHQLQYTQLVLLNFNGLSWPHVTVGTLRRA